MGVGRDDSVGDTSSGRVASRRDARTGTASVAGPLLRSDAPVTPRALMLCAATLLILAACSRQPKVPQAVVAGGDAGGMPRAEPSDEHLDASALKAAAQDAVTHGLQALVVLRHGHIVYERYGHGVNGSSDR